MGCHMSLTGCPLSSMQLALDTGLALLLNWGFIIWLLIVSMQLAFDRFPNCIVYYQSRGWGPWLSWPSSFLYLIIVRVPDDSDSQNLLPSIAAGRAVNIYVYLYIYISIISYVYLFICLYFHMFIFFLSIAAGSAVSPREVIVHSIDQVRVFFIVGWKIVVTLWFQNNTKIYGKVFF